MPKHIPIINEVNIIIYFITTFLRSVGAQAQAEELRSSSFTLGEA